MKNLQTSSGSNLPVLFLCVFLQLLFPAIKILSQTAKQIDSCEILLKNPTQDTNRVITLNYLCWSCFHVNISKAKKYCDEAYALSVKLGYKPGKARSLILFGNIFFKQGLYKKSIDVNMEGLKLREELNDRHGIASGLGNIGLIYQVLNQQEKGLEYHIKSLEMFQELENEHPSPDFEFSMAGSMTNIGYAYNELHKYDEALVKFREALRIFEKLDNKPNIAASLNNIGTVYSKLGKINETLEYQKKALALYTEIGDSVGICTAESNLAGDYLNAQEFDKAIQSGTRALDIAKKFSMKDDIQFCYWVLSTAYSEKGDYKIAYELQLLHRTVKDSILNEQTAEQITEMQAKYESEKKEKEILLLKKDKQLQVSEVRRQRILRNSFIAASCLALLLAFLLFNRYQIKQRANKLLANQNEQIMQQKNLIEQQKQDITDSIEYASNIQRAMLPSEQEISEVLPEYFVLYKPKAIVSGDFYWVAPLYPPEGGTFMSAKSMKDAFENSIKSPLRGIAGHFSPPKWGEPEGGRGLLLCTADCTGHGVPGAFMSMLCTALLNEAVNDKGITSPEKIFEEVRRGIIAALKQKGKMGESKDGMDATLILLSSPPNPLSTLERGKGDRGVLGVRCACANNPVYIASNGILNEILPDRFPVGVYEGNLNPFSLHTASLQKGDVIYTMTDGYEDQLGGEKQKKFKSKRLKELFLSIAGKPVYEQKEILEKTFDVWKGAGEQTDDITVIGIRI